MVCDARLQRKRGVPSPRCVSHSPSTANPPPSARAGPRPPPSAPHAHAARPRGGPQFPGSGLPVPASGAAPSPPPLRSGLGPPPPAAPAPGEGRRRSKPGPMQLNRAAVAAAAAPAEPPEPLSPALAPAPAPPGPLPRSAVGGAPAGGQGGPGRRAESPCAPLSAGNSPGPGASIGMDGPGASAVVVRVGIPDLQQTVSPRDLAVPLCSPLAVTPAGRALRQDPRPRPLAPPPPPPRDPPHRRGGAREGQPRGGASASAPWRGVPALAPQLALHAGPGARCPALAGPGSRLAPLQKCLRLDPTAPVWAAKQRVLCALNHSLQDALNYGLFQPPSRGRAGKFLDEERLLQDYPPNLDTPLPYLEVLGRPGWGWHGAHWV